MKVVIDGIEYVPRAEIPEITEDALYAALVELVGIQYFYGGAGKPRAKAWDALNALAPELAELCSQDAAAAYARLVPEEDS